MPRLASIATALPEHRVGQDDVMAILAKARGAALPARLTAILGNSGVEERYLVREPDYYLEPRNWPERASIFADAGSTLAKRAALEALDKAKLCPADIECIIFISTTGTMTPSIPSQMIAAMGFDPSTRTVPVFGYGCAGGVLGLGLARDLSFSGSCNVLLISLELCSLSYDYSQFAKKDMIATALFADGCAAAVISAKDIGDVGPSIGAFAQKTWPGTRDMMGWDIAETGFDLVLSRDIPSFVTKEFAPFCDDFLKAQCLEKTDLSEPSCHPGGGRVIGALEDYFMPDVAGIPTTREVLRRYGNMSSPTVLFVLEQLLAENPQKPLLLTALGPGFTAAVGLLEP